MHAIYRIHSSLDTCYKWNIISTNYNMWTGIWNTHVTEITLLRNLLGTRNLGQIPTWGRSAPYFQLGNSLGGWNSACSPERSCTILHSTRSVDLGWINIRIYNIFVSGPKFTKKIVRPTWKGCSWLLAFPIFDISSVPEVFAIKVWSCPKWRQILHVFGPNFLEEGPIILGPRL